MTPRRVCCWTVVIGFALPWLAGCRHDPGEQKGAPSPDKPAVNSKVPLDHPEAKMIVTKQYRTHFKGLTLGLSTLEEANKRPNTVSGTLKPGPNPLLEPDLWIGEATLHFDKHDKTLTSVQIYDVGFVDINGITVGGPWSQLEKIAGKAVTQSFHIDERNGVVYWDDEGRGTVTKIVYVSNLQVRAD
jgi:hypothetical protein